MDICILLQYQYLSGKGKGMTIEYVEMETRVCSDSLPNHAIQSKKRTIQYLCLCLCIHLLSVNQRFTIHHVPYW